MQAAGFVCRSCLARLQQPCRKPSQLRSARRIHDTSTARQQPLPVPSIADSASAGGARRDDDAAAAAPSSRESATWNHEQQPLITQSNKPTRSTRWADRLAAQELELDRGFDAVNYPTNDSEFWDKYDELWNPATEHEHEHEPRTAGNDAQGRSPRPEASVPKPTRRPTKPPAGAWWGQRPQDQKIEFALALRGAPDVERAKKRYRVWKKQFSSLWRAAQNGKLPPTKGMPSDLKWLLRFETVGAMKEAWHLQPEARREAKWIHVMVGALRFTPAKAHEVLEAILEAEQVHLAPFYAVRDTIYLLLQKSKLETSGKHKVEQANRLADLVRLLAQTTPRGYLLLRQHTIYHIISNVSGERLASLYAALHAYKHPLHSNTLLQFARFLARDVANKHLSLAILRELVASSSVDINSPHGAALCTSILSLPEEDAHKELKPTPAQFFEMLLELGLRPNIITYSTILRNLCLNKELKVAWEVFDVMQGHQIEPDVHVFSILLNGAKLCDDYGSISRVLRLAASQEIGTPILWNDALHTMFLLYQREARAKRLKRPWVLPAFHAMYRAYASVYRTEALQVFALSDLTPLLREPLGHEASERDRSLGWRSSHSKALALISQLPPARQPEELLEPGTDTLGLMLIGYVGGFSQVYNIIAFYSRFRSLLKNGNPVAVRFVHEKGTLLHDIVIKAVVEWQGMLRVALDVVSDMIKDAIATASSPSTDGAARHPAPSSYTWNILLNGFMHQQHRRQGERILTMMREHGVDPDTVTWNTLLAGYARTQQVNKTVGALQRLERSGFKPDEYTMRGFSYLSNPKAAVEMMENMMQQRQEKEQLAKLQESCRLETDDENAGVEAALRDMEMVVDEVADQLTTGPGIQDVEAYDWGEAEGPVRQGAA